MGAVIVRRTTTAREKYILRSVGHGCLGSIVGLFWSDASATNKGSYQSPCNLGPMSDRESESLISARPDPVPAAARPSGARSDQGRGRGGPGRTGEHRSSAGDGRPEPARALGDAGPSDTIPVEETTVNHDGMEWIVRVRGRSGGREAVAPLLLLGFWKARAEDESRSTLLESEPDGEALVVGTSLAQLGDGGLRIAIAGSKPPPPQTRSAEQPTTSRR